MELKIVILFYQVELSLIQIKIQGLVTEIYIILEKKNGALETVSLRKH